MLHDVSLSVKIKKFPVKAFAHGSKGLYSNPLEEHGIPDKITMAGQSNRDSTDGKSHYGAEGAGGGVSDGVESIYNVHGTKSLVNSNNNNF